jgi:CHAT domain
VISPLGQGPVRVLLVICRPGGGDDVAFRSVARRVLQALTPADPDRIQLHVLRPPTFDQLARTLQQAERDGKPYHIVHFDGHGGYSDLSGIDRTLLLESTDEGEHGRLLFENPKIEENRQYVRGSRIGSLLANTRCPVLLLNACRSAHSEPASRPISDPHQEIRAFGSVAQEVADSGVAGVLAMRYNVFVETAANFVGELYGQLAAGCPLGEAVTLGRKSLADQPLRSITFDPRPLQDWQVPLVFEAAPVALFPKTESKILLTSQATEDSALPPRPDSGFIGRDETLLALDRAFDTQTIVLLHAYAGSGKTATAAEFARWYKATGFEGPILFTSFEQHKPLARVLDQLEPIFRQVLEQNNIHWLTLTDDQRRKFALQIFAQIPVLWIWDNIEPIAGFPKGTPSAWTPQEQKEFCDFLLTARDTNAKFLLTSRRDEQDWLHDLPRRIKLPKMRFEDMLALTRALAEKHGHRITDVEDWGPLLKFAQGNPLTVTVVVGQALRNRLRTRAQIEAFVEQLRTGQCVFEDEESEGRTRSLGASLSYGFEHAFTETERKQLALLHVFQGFVDVDALRIMGNPEQEWHLAEVSGLTRDSGIALLDRAAEIGLLTAHGGGYYSIHPALPWLFRQLFEQHYGASDTRATRAYVEAIGQLGNYYHNQYADGNSGIIASAIQTVGMG